MTEVEFRELADRWRDETGGMSNPRRIYENDAYQKIIAAGITVVPFILADLRATGSLWYGALRTILEREEIEPPVIPPVKSSRIVQDIWLTWGDGFMRKVVHV